MLNEFVKYVLGDVILGRLDYFRFPECRDSWGGAFNGQRKRLELFKAIINEIKPRAIIETGTYRGTTAVAFAQTGLPVFTVESLARNYGFAKAQLKGYRNVTIIHRDSREGINYILSGPAKVQVKHSLFFYLDAHWDSDLPLAEELDIIAAMCSRAVIMIDDFEVPGDLGYGYDDYGEPNVLNAAYIADCVQRHKLNVLYPIASSTEETGARRGCVVLCGGADGAALLKTGLFRQDQK